MGGNTAVENVTKFILVSPLLFSFDKFIISYLQKKNNVQVAQNSGNLFVKNYLQKSLDKKCGVWYNGFGGLVLQVSGTPNKKGRFKTAPEKGNKKGGKWTLWELNPPEFPVCKTGDHPMQSQSPKRWRF